MGLEPTWRPFERVAEEYDEVLPCFAEALVAAPRRRMRALPGPGASRATPLPLGRRPQTVATRIEDTA